MTLASLSLKKNATQLQITVSSTVAVNFNDFLANKVKFHTENRTGRRPNTELIERYRWLNNITNTEEINSTLQGTPHKISNHSQLTTQKVAIFPEYNVVFCDDKKEASELLEQDTLYVTFQNPSPFSYPVVLDEGQNHEAYTIYIKLDPVSVYDYQWVCLDENQRLEDLQDADIEDNTIYTKFTWNKVYCKLRSLSGKLTSQDWYQSEFTAKTNQLINLEDYKDSEQFKSRLLRLLQIHNHTRQLGFEYTVQTATGEHTGMVYWYKIDNASNLGLLTVDDITTNTQKIQIFLAKQHKFDQLMSYVSASNNTPTEITIDDLSSLTFDKANFSNANTPELVQKLIDIARRNKDLPGQTCLPHNPQYTMNSTSHLDSITLYQTTLTLPTTPHHALIFLLALSEQIAGCDSINFVETPLFHSNKLFQKPVQLSENIAKNFILEFIEKTIPVLSSIPAYKGVIRAFIAIGNHYNAKNEALSTAMKAVNLNTILWDGIGTQIGHPDIEPVEKNRLLLELIEQYDMNASERTFMINGLNYLQKLNFLYNTPAVNKQYPTYGYTEWEFLCGTNFELIDNQMVITNFSENKGYTVYAPGGRLHDAFIAEMTRFFETNGLKLIETSHSRLVFDEASSEKLSRHGLHINQGYLDNLITCNQENVVTDDMLIDSPKILANNSSRLWPTPTRVPSPTPPPQSELFFTRG